MARTNVNSNRLQTFNRAPARQLSPEQTLERTVLACLLWEKQFYESGEDIAARIERLASEVSPVFVAELAYRTRHEGNLRHVPLLLLYALTLTGAGIPNLVQDAISNTIARADEVTEFLSIYWAHDKPGKARRPLSAQTKKGLAAAIAKFDAYQLAKWDKDAPVKLRDALRMVHAKPQDDKQAKVFKGLAERSLKSTRTWEARQSKTGQKTAETVKLLDLTVAQATVLKQTSKRETWENQLRGGELGYDALLKNLRNMIEAGVDPELMAKALVARRGAHRILPFRFVAAFNAIKAMVGHSSQSNRVIVQQALDTALQGVVSELPKISGKTAILVDVSQSMSDKLSEKSDLHRWDAAASLATLFPGTADIYSVSDQLVRVEAKGLRGIEQIIRSQRNNGTNLGGAVDEINRYAAAGRYNRLIVLTDEQSNNPIAAPACPLGYLINLASYEPSVGEKMPLLLADAPIRCGKYGYYKPHSVDFGPKGEWLRITGFSENVFRFIDSAERSLF